MEEEWFCAPRRLLPPPATIIRNFQQKPLRAHKPAALNTGSSSAEKASAPTKRKKPEEPRETEATPSQATHNRYLWGEEVVVVPCRCEDLEENFPDADNELLLIEVFQGSWLEDPQVAYVHVRSNHGEKLLPIKYVRNYVRDKPEVFRKPLVGLKKLNHPFRSRVHAQKIFFPVAVSDFQKLLESSVKAPPTGPQASP